jgi:hypothetical protein
MKIDPRIAGNADKCLIELRRPPHLLAIQGEQLKL